MGEHHSWSLPGLGPYITPQTDSPSPLPWMALIIARTSLGLDGSVSCLWRWDCRCLRGMTLLVVADLYLPSSASGTEAGEPGAPRAPPPQTC